jgi:hypothetical protein
MRSGANKFSRLLPIVMIGLAMRALVPAGYMPGTLGGGPWFELCSDAFPAGFSLQAQATAHHHHAASDGENTDTAASSDCSFGHIVSGAVLPGGIAFFAGDRPASLPIATEISDPHAAQTKLRPRTRAPPSAS